MVMDTTHGSYQHSERKPQQPSWYARATLVTSLTAVLMGLAGMTSPTDAFDVAIGEIHITQGMQHSDPLFWVPLVAERSTAVRVQVERVSGTPGPATGKLRVWVDEQEITPSGGVDDLNQTFPAPYNSFVPPPTPSGGFFYLLEHGDHYDYVSDPAVEAALFRDMWSVLQERNAPCWISQSNTLTQYQFYVDPSFLPGPLYRYSGFEVSVGPVIVHNIGWYFRAGQSTPLKAAYVNVALGDILLVIVDNDIIAEAFWHFGNSLVITLYNADNNCL